jgi:hypothetical protein
LAGANQPSQSKNNADAGSSPSTFGRMRNQQREPMFDPSSNYCDIQLALSSRWKVVDAGHKLSEYSTCEDLSIITECNQEVVGCSEWMRADREIFDHIVCLHNLSLNPPNAQDQTAGALPARKA